MNPQDILFVVFLILYIAFIGTTLFMGLFLIFRGFQNKMDNLIIAGTGFILPVIGFIGNFLFSFKGIFLEIFVFSGFILCVIFTNMTFHKHKSKVPIIILLITISLGIVQFIFFILYSITGLNLYYIRVSFDLIYTLLVFNWLAFSSYMAYRTVKNHDIQPWIKIRYKMVAIFSFILSFHNIPEFFQPRGINWGDPTNLISLTVFGATSILGVIFSSGFTFAWIMPKYCKKFFNRHYKTPKDMEINEKELMGFLRKELRKNPK